MPQCPEAPARVSQTSHTKLTTLFLRAVAPKFNTSPGSRTKRGKKETKGSESLDFFAEAN